MKFVWILLLATTSLYCADSKKLVLLPKLDLLRYAQRSMYDQINKFNPDHVLRFANNCIKVHIERAAREGVTPEQFVERLNLVKHFTQETDV